MLKRKLPTVKLPQCKGTAGLQPVRVLPPKEVLLPMTMHSGSAAVPIVSVGERVLLGQLVAREDGRNSSPVHATVSGVVTAVDSDLVRIESDGKMERDPAIAAPEVHELEGFLRAVRDSGIVGLGGAAFPLWAKLDAVRRSPIRTVLVNGAECEPFITSDHRTMLEHSDMIVKGVALLKEYLKSEEFIIGVEKNKPDAIAELRCAFAADPSVTVKPLEDVYPQGAKQVLLYNATGKVVGEGQRLASLGVIIINVTTLAKMAQFMTDGMPLVEKCITVDGSAVREPKNLIVPIGTPISYVIEQAGGLCSAPGKVIYGGPMTGRTAKSVDEPILKATNAILVLNEKDSKAIEPTACIHCGRCVASCPLGLDPVGYAKAMELEDDERRYAALDRGKVMTCMECGCCSYVCPAHRPLVQNNRDAKRFVRRIKAASADLNGAKK